MPPAPGPTPPFRHPAVVAALLVLAVCMVVALAVPGYGLLLPAGGGAWVRPVAMAAVALGAVGLLRMRRRTPRQSRHDADPTFAAFVGAAALMVLLATVAYMAPRAPAPDLPAPNPPGRMGNPDDQASERTGPAREPRPRTASGGGFNRSGQGSSGGGGNVVAGEPMSLPGVSNSGFRRSWGTALLLGLLLIVAAIVYFNRRGGALQKWFWVRDEDPGPAPHVDAAQAEASLAASLGAMDYAGDDPRRQIAAAYHRLLAALADAGAAREAQEAPFEYLARVLEPLGVPRAPLHTLTELYVLAQFSQRPVTGAHTDAATAAFQEARASLPQRARVGVPTQDAALESRERDARPPRVSLRGELHD